MNRVQLKYYLKQVSKPVSLIALTIGFVGVLIGAGGLLLAVRYGKLLNELQQKNQTVTQQVQENEVSLGDANGVKYQVVAGDSTWNLAEQFYGDGRLYPVIERANKLQPDERLTVGHELVIPLVPGVLDRQSNLEAKPSPSTISTSENYRLETNLQPSASGEKHEKYVVQPGDSLWFISLKYLGSGYKWTELYELNRQTVGHNPDLIYPGTELVLPTATK